MEPLGSCLRRSAGLLILAAIAPEIVVPRRFSCSRAPLAALTIAAVDCGVRQVTGRLG